jgi:probable HAF family extracellular repeat protein
MKSITLLTSTMVLAVLLSGCGGGGGGGAAEAPAQPAASPTQVAEVAPPAPAAAVQADFPYTITLLGTLGGESYAVAINDQAQVAGNYLDQNNNPNAFIWQDGTMRGIMQSGQASAINNKGQVVGWREATGQPEAFRYDLDGRSYLLNTGGASKALAINEAGQAAGRLTGLTDQAFVEDKGNLQIVSGELNAYAVAMNNVGQILVKEITAAGFRTLLWQNGVLTDLGNLGGPCTQGQDVNDAGQVVGWAQTAAGEYHAFIWERGVLTDLAPLVGSFSSAIAINNQGLILLKASTQAGENTFLYQNGQVTDLENFGSNYAVATDLNINGQIVGWLATDNGAIRAFMATPKK